MPKPIKDETMTSVLNVGTYDCEDGVVTATANELEHSVTLTVSGVHPISRAGKLSKRISRELTKAGIEHDIRLPGTAHPKFILTGGGNETEQLAMHALMVREVEEFLGGFETTASKDGGDAEKPQPKAADFLPGGVDHVGIDHHRAAVKHSRNADGRNK